MAIYDNSTSYAYDHGDNITTAGGNTLHYDPANEATSLVNTQGTTSYSYDTRGNRTQVISPSQQVTTLTYDQANRLTGYGSSATYAYNGDGLRMSKTISGTTEQFSWNTAAGLPMLLADGSTNFIYGPGGTPLEQVASNGSVYFYYHDALGSTRAISDTTGAIVATYSYDAYGNLTSSTGSVYNPLQYAGQYVDRESGYVYLQARYYDPATEQFLTRDPLVPMTKQPYGYTGGNPVNFVDVSGNCAQLASLNLPTGGKYPYVSGLKGGGPNKLPNGQGYKDKYGNVWKKDKGNPDHWDVEHPDGSYTNVDENGNPDHGTENFPQTPKAKNNFDSNSGTILVGIGIFTIVTIAIVGAPETGGSSLLLLAAA